MIRQWNKMEKDKTEAMIGAVRKSREGALFSIETSGAQVAKLPFYRNYHLYRLTNFSSLPAFSFDYLGDGQRFYFLDGTVKPLATVAAKNDLFLNTGNVLDYTDFYFRYVTKTGDNVRIIRRPEDHPALSSMPDAQMADIKKHHKEPEISFDEQTPEGKYHIKATLDNDGTLTRAHLAVSPKGLVSIIEQHMLLTEQHDSIKAGS